MTAQATRRKRHMSQLWYLRIALLEHTDGVQSNFKGRASTDPYTMCCSVEMCNIEAIFIGTLVLGLDLCCGCWRTHPMSFRFCGWWMLAHPPHVISYYRINYNKRAQWKFRRCKAMVMIVWGEAIRKVHVKVCRITCCCHGVAFFILIFLNCF